MDRTAETQPTAIGYGIAAETSAEQKIVQGFVEEYADLRITAETLYRTSAVLCSLCIERPADVPQNAAEIDEWIATYAKVYLEGARSPAYGRNLSPYPEWRASSALARVWIRDFREKRARGVLSWEKVRRLSLAENDEGQAAREDVDAVMQAHFGVIPPAAAPTGAEASRGPEEEAARFPILEEARRAPLSERREILSKMKVMEMRELGVDRHWVLFARKSKNGMIDWIMEKEGLLEDDV